MSRLRNRNLAVTRTPQIEVRSWDQQVRVTTGTLKGDTMWNVTADLDVQCAARLVLELRKGIRAVRKAEIASLNGSVEFAEQVLP